MSIAPLTGFVAATHTAFHPDGSINLDAVDRQAAHLLSHHITGAFIGGTTGECHSLTTEERRQLSRRWASAVQGTTLKLVVHVGHNCLEDARALAAQAQDHGAHAIAALAPSYFKPPTVEALVDFCAAIAAAAPALPFYFYDIPSMTGVAFPTSAFLRLAKERIPTLAGAKFTNTDLVMLQECLRLNNGAFDILFGNDETLLSALSLGVRGAIGSTYNFAAPIYHRLLTAFDAGDMARARSEQLKSVDLVRVCSSYGFLAASKVVMRMLGVDCGTVRPPLVPLAESQTKALRQGLETMGFFDWIA